jgi:hypothetical protein
MSAGSLRFPARPLTLPPLRGGPLPLPVGARGKNGAVRSLSPRGEGQGEGEGDAGSSVER